LLCSSLRLSSAHHWRLGGQLGDYSFERYGYQYEPDFFEYDKIILIYSPHFHSMIDIAGNHDEFGLYRFDSINQSRVS
jgi:hypothetical protein